MLYKNLIAAIDQYNNTPKEVITANIHRLLLENITENIRHDRQYNAAYIAEQIGVAPQTVWGWNKKKHGGKPKFETAVKLCDLLDVNLNELMKDIKVEEVEDNRPNCKTEGCPNKANAAKGLCHKCYQRQRREEKNA